MIVNSLLVGQVVPFGPNGELSAIGKVVVSRPLHLGVNGFDDDAQADLRHHGGPDKAVHHYPAEHYATWQRELPEISPECFLPGAFGENLSTLGLTEENACIGDIFRIGDAHLQVSQARQPCWKLNVRFGQPEMSKKIQDSGRTGWYYRVLKTGEVAPGAEIQLLERPCPDWPLARLLNYLYIDPLNIEALMQMETLTVLPAAWREMAQRRLETNSLEDWSRRLGTPGG
jgi:MOSC domain-containing protein YiiM